MKKILLMVSIVALLAAGCGKTATNAPASPNNNEQTKAPLQAAQNPDPSAGKYKTIEVLPPTVAYTSTADGFTVNYPSSPKVTKTTVPTPNAGAIPVTEYRKTFSSGSEYAFYTVSVYHYPPTYKLTGDDLSSGLQTFNKILIALYPGTKVANQQSAEFLGNPALTGTLVVPVKLTPGNAATTDTSDYFTATINGQNIYVISAYGMDQNNYNAFLKSFKFTK